MNIKLIVSSSILVLMSSLAIAAHHEAAENPNEAVAVNWLKAQATGKARDHRLC